MGIIKRLLSLSAFLWLVCNLGLSQSYKIGIISDIHYLSEKLTDKGVSTQKYVVTTGRNIIDVPQVLDSVLREYADENIDALLIPGDLTKDGEKQSHIDFAEKLKALTDSGVKVFVVPGNHDINIPHPVSYKGDGTFPTENVSPEEFKEIYSHCGYSSALVHDSSTLSYVAVIVPGIWLLSIDSNLYEEQNSSAGRIPSSTAQWIVDILADAKENNIKVIAMMHHGLVEHIAYQGLLLPQYLVNDWQRLARLFADNGLKVVFTGHSHANDASGFLSADNNKIIDIETGALCSYPFPYRYAEISGDEISVYTKNMKSVSGNPGLKEEGRLLLCNAVQNMVRYKINNRFKDITPELSDLMIDVASEIFILHAEGDEVVGDTLKNKIERIAGGMDFPIDLSPEYFQLDFPPSDNALKFLF